VWMEDRNWMQRNITLMGQGLHVAGSIYSSNFDAGTQLQEPSPGAGTRPTGARDLHLAKTYGKANKTYVWKQESREKKTRVF